MGFQDEKQLRAWCVKTIYDGVGKQLLLFPTHALSYQQVAQPVMWNEKCYGYFVLSSDKKGKRDVVVQTFLKPHARQILDASGTDPMPPWFLDFQLRRK